MALRYRVRLLELDGKTVELGTMLSLPYPGGFSVGDVVAFEAAFSPPEEDSAIYRKADGIFLSAEAESAEKTGVREKKAAGFFEKIRLFMQRNFKRYIGGDEAGFATAIMTGNRENLDGSVRLAFSRIGISHILAVSGLHLSIVIGGLDLICQWAAIPRKLKNILLILCSLLFACICGLSASVIRAAIMLSFLYLADTVGENHDSLTSLFVAIFLILFFRPTAVYDVGMWMSFLATLGILATISALPQMFLGKRNRVRMRIFRFVLTLFCVTVSATFFTLPVTYLAFDGISLVSPIANLLFVPLVQILLYVLVALTALSAFPLAAAPIGSLARMLIALICDTAVRFSEMEGIYLSLRYPFVRWMIVLLIVGVLSVLMIRNVKSVCIFGVFALCAAFYAVGYIGYMQTEGQTGYVYLETDGKSDAVGIVSAGKSALIDVSTGGHSVLSRAADRMAHFCECEIDVLVLTHYHSYHPNTLRKLMNRIKIHRVFLPEPSTEQEIRYYRAICEALGEGVDITVYPADGSRRLQVGAAVVTLPDSERIERSTHPIVRFSASFGEKGFSYLGESATETDWSDGVREVVVFGSHGPAMRDGLDLEPVADAEQIVFADRAHTALTDTSDLKGKISFPEDSGGWVKIPFPPKAKCKS